MVAGLLIATPLWAAGRVAPLVPKLNPLGASEIRDRFHDAIARGLERPNAEVVAAPEVRLRLGSSEELIGCGAGPCLARVAGELHVDQLVASDIDVIGKQYTIKLRALSPSGRLLGQIEESCDICTLKEAEETATRVAGRLASVQMPAPDRPPAPSGATEPAPPPAAAPSPGNQQRGALESRAAPAPSDRRFPWRWLAIGSAALGVVGLAVGIPLLAIDGNPTCDMPNPRRTCPDVYNTAAAGGTLLGFGIAGLAASGVFFYLDHRAAHRPRPAVSLLPLPGGAFVTAGGSF
jgi:hypothetical protein